MVTSSDPVATSVPSSPRRRPPRILPWIGILLHLGLGLFPYAPSGLTAPPYGVVVLGVLWLAILVAAVLLLPRHPWWVVATPVVSVAVWLGVMTFGVRELRWTP